MLNEISIRPDMETLSREVKDYYNKADLAFKKSNYDYAIELLSRILSIQPDLIEARRYLRLVENKRLQEKPPSIQKRISNKTKALFTTLKAVILESKSNYLAAIEEYERVLIINPKNTFVLTKLGEAFVKANMPDEAIDAFEAAFEITAENIQVAKKLGFLYREKTDFKKARFYYEHALGISPEDPEAQEGLKEVDTRETIAKGRWEDQETYRTKIKDGEEAEKLEKEDRVVRTESDIDYLIKSNLEKFKETPQDINLLRTLGQLYTRKADFDNALEYYQKALEVDPANIAFKARLGELQLAKIQKEIEKKESGPQSPKTAEEVEELKSRRDELRLKELENRVAQYPGDLALRFEYGALLKNEGKLDKAIGEFQTAVKDPSRQTQALNMLGSCFREKKMYDLAVDQFKKALEGLSTLNAEKKEVIYNLGITYEEMGKAELAIEEFKKIYKVDIGYKDVAQKVDKAYKG